MASNSDFSIQVLHVNINFRPMPYNLVKFKEKLFGFHCSKKLFGLDSNSDLTKFNNEIANAQLRAGCSESPLFAYLKSPRPIFIGAESHDDSIVSDLYKIMSWLISTSIGDSQPAKGIFIAPHMSDILTNETKNRQASKVLAIPAFLCPYYFRAMYIHAKNPEDSWADLCEQLRKELETLRDKESGSVDSYNMLSAEIVQLDENLKKCKSLYVFAEFRGLAAKKNSSEETIRELEFENKRLKLELEHSKKTEAALRRNILNLKQCFGK